MASCCALKASSTALTWIRRYRSCILSCIVSPQAGLPVQCYSDLPQPYSSAEISGRYQRGTRIRGYLYAKFYVALLWIPAKL
ncbi:hypothetical protein PENSPDRAFT_218865 [Peniophora sp. CONT]|nr:hypothetical protein PENSPDRAFT_218865 [Peniophora sp. CONT]